MRQRKKSTAAISTWLRFNILRAASSAAASLTRMWTRSTRERCFDDLAVHPRNRLKLAGPVRFLMRPCEPCAFVRLPFRRHPETAAILADPPVRDRSVRVDAAIAQERPVSADFIHLARVAFRYQHFFLVCGGLRDHLAERIRDE